MRVGASEPRPDATAQRLGHRSGAIHGGEEGVGGDRPQLGVRLGGDGENCAGVYGSTVHPGTVTVRDPVTLVEAEA